MAPRAAPARDDGNQMEGLEMNQNFEPTIVAFCCQY